MAITLIPLSSAGAEGTAITFDPTSISTQRYFPRKVEHTLMSGNMVSYTPHHKVMLTIELEYLSKVNYSSIMANIDNRFKIQSEESGIHPIDTEIVYLYSGDTLDFTYTNQFKGAGFSGTLNFLETYIT